MTLGFYYYLIKCCLETEKLAPSMVACIEKIQRRDAFMRFCLKQCVTFCRVSYGVTLLFSVYQIIAKLLA